MPKPRNEYQTTFIWSGLKCLNPHIQKCFVFFPAGDFIERAEIEYPDHLSRVDYIEEVRVCVYDENMYSENDELFVKHVIEKETPDSNSQQHFEVEPRPLTQKPRQSGHAEAQHLSTRSLTLLRSEIEERFESLLEQHVKQVLPSADPSNA